MRLTRTTLLIALAALSTTLAPAAAHAGNPASTAAPTVPRAPSAISPANGAKVLVPLPISWTAVSDPTGIVAYNWQVSPSSSFTPVVEQDSTSGATNATVSGLAVGRYFWRAQAVNGAFQQGAWSAARSFDVTGVGAGEPGTPILNPPKGGTAFHPFETITFNWSAVPGAATYVFEADKNARFPVGSTRIHFDNIATTTTSVLIGDFCGGCEQGNYLARVYAVGANGNRGVRSATVSFSVFYNNPLPAPPTPLAPVAGITVGLPITFSWTDVPNPQDNGYQIQISRNATFTLIEDDIPLITPNQRIVPSLTAGPKFWRIRSTQGDASPSTAAITAWSRTATFTVSAAPATVSSITLSRPNAFSGEDEFGDVQLSAAAPAGGAVVRLTSSNPTAAPVPASVTVPAGLAVLTSAYTFSVGQVTAATPVTITATLGTSSATTQITVRPPSLQSLTLTPNTTSGGVATGAVLMLNGHAPATGAIVTLASTSAAVRPPATVTLAPGSPSASFAVATGNVTVSTSATVTATWNGVSVSTVLTVLPAPAPVSLVLSPSTTTGAGGSVTGRVTVASARPVDQALSVSSNNAAVLPFLATSVTIPAGTSTGDLLILPRSVSVTTIVRITVSGGGVTRFADLTINPDGTPPPAATLASFTVNPTSVVGGNPATGTVSLPAAAPAGGTIVSLGSNLPGAASVPANITIPAGATRVSFTVTTFTSAGTTVQLTATNGDTTLFAPLGVTAP